MKRPSLCALRHRWSERFPGTLRLPDGTADWFLVVGVDAAGRRREHRETTWPLRRCARCGAVEKLFARYDDEWWPVDPAWRVEPGNAGHPVAPQRALRFVLRTFYRTALTRDPR